MSNPTQPVTLAPRQLQDLFAVFDRLEQGHGAALVPADTPLSIRRDLTLHGVELAVTSSGSTGRPKQVWHSWSSMKGQATRSADLTGWTWAAPYEPYSYAGVQVALHAWLNSGTVISLTGDWSRNWNRLAERRVDAVSATPTFLDLLLQNEPGERTEWKPMQVTLGGEPLRPGLGERLGRRFPETRFTAIYASAEFGVLTKTHRLDGWYETKSLEQRWPEWRVSEGVLELREGDEWRSTGDRVEARERLFRVVGRADNIANIAGTKVNLAEIADLAEQAAGVRRALAVAEPSPVTGQIVALKYALEPGVDEEATLERLQAHLRDKLRKEAWPRRWVKAELAPAKNAKRALE